MVDATDTADPEKGTTLQGRYRLGHVLGRGSRAVVREARDLHCGRGLAVKMLRPEHARSQLAVQQLDREILIQGRLSWPALTLYDRGISTHGLPYYVADLAPGVTVAEILVLRAGRRLALEPALWIAADVARAIHNASSFGVVHGNLCPAKVLVSKRESLDNETAHLIDFSRRRIVDVDRFEPRPEDLDPGWRFDADPPEKSWLALVPEDLSGRKRHYQSDIFGLGALIFEMIAGPLPTMEAIVGGWKPHDVLGDAVPIQLKHLIAESLEPSPEVRRRSAYDIFLEIMQVIARIHPPDPEFPAEPGPGASSFHYSAQRPPWIDWRLHRLTA